MQPLERKSIVRRKVLTQKSVECDTILSVLTLDNVDWATKDPQLLERTMIEREVHK